MTPNKYLIPLGDGIAGHLFYYVGTAQQLARDLPTMKTPSEQAAQAANDNKTNGNE
jgi:hypothetical protein